MLSAQTRSPSTSSSVGWRPALRANRELDRAAHKRARDFQRNQQAHDDEDELFLVVSGHLRIELEGRDEVRLIR